MGLSRYKFPIFLEALSFQEDAGREVTLGRTLSGRSGPTVAIDGSTSERQRFNEKGGRSDGLRNVPLFGCRWLGGDGPVGQATIAALPISSIDRCPLRFGEFGSDP